MALIKRIEDDVCILSNDKELIGIVEKVVDELNLNLYYAECTTDLYAFGAFYYIVDPALLESDFMENFRELYELTSPKEVAVMLTASSKIPREIKPYFIFADENGKVEQQLKMTMLNRRSNIISQKTNKRDYSKKLNRLFAILRHLQPEGNYIRIPELAKEFGVSEKTIKRDLIYLKQEGGEEIVYDRKTKAYYLNNSISSRIITRYDKEFH